MSLENSDEIRKSGYKFFSSHRPNGSIVKIAERFGKGSVYKRIIRAGGSRGYWMHIGHRVAVGDA